MCATTMPFAPLKGNKTWRIEQAAIVSIWSVRGWRDN